MIGLKTFYLKSSPPRLPPPVYRLPYLLNLPGLLRVSISDLIWYHENVSTNFTSTSRRGTVAKPMYFISYFLFK